MKLKKTWAFSDNTYINNKISKNLNTYRAADVNCITNQQEDQVPLECVLCYKIPTRTTKRTSTTHM